MSCNLSSIGLLFMTVGVVTILTGLILLIDSLEKEHERNVIRDIKEGKRDALGKDLTK